MADNVNDPAGAGDDAAPEAEESSIPTPPVAPQGSGADPAAAPAAELPPASESAKKRDTQFRHGLLAKLSKLGYSAWSVKDNFKIDEELGSAVSLSADSILGPVEPLAPERMR